jgi:hypothetical protein
MGLLIFGATVPAMFQRGVRGGSLLLRIAREDLGEDLESSVSAHATHRTHIFRFLNPLPVPRIRMKNRLNCMPPLLPDCHLASTLPPPFLDFDRA